MCYNRISIIIKNILSGGLTIHIFLMLTGFFVIFSCSPNPDNGEIKEFFFFDNDSLSQLTVWYSLERGGRGATYIREKLKAYDLQTGKVLGSVILSKDMFYKLYACDRNEAWGYCKKNGVQLLDLVKPGVIATEQELLKRNPQLGKQVTLYLRNVYDPVTNILHVFSADSQVYGLDADLKATIKENVPERLPPEKKGWDFAKEWYFYDLPHHLGEHLHKKKAECSANSATLLGPKLIKEFNKNVKQKDKVWTIHKSAIIGEYDLLLSLVVPNGEELARLNFQKILKKDKWPKVLGTYTTDTDVFIFITSGIQFKYNIEGYSFKALRTDAKSGELLEQINYY